MNLADALDLPPPTPPAPLPTPIAPTTEAVQDVPKNDEQARTQADLLHSIQQRFLSSERDRLMRLLQDGQPRWDEAAYIFHKHICGHTHLGMWDNLAPFVRAFSHYGGELRQGLIILGGWLRPAPAGLDDLQPCSAQWINDLHDYAIYRQAQNLLVDCSGGPRAAILAARQRLADYLALHPDYFPPCSPDQCKDLLDAELRDLYPKVKGSILLMRQRALCFFSDPADPAEAWVKFGRFAHDYNFVPDELRINLGPHFFSVRLPSTPPNPKPYLSVY